MINLVGQKIVEKIVYKEAKIKDKWKTNPIRIIGILILGFLTFLMFISLFISEKGTTDYLIVVFMFFAFSVPLFFLVKKERIWRKEYKEYKNTQNQKRQNEFIKKNEIELKENEKIEKRKEMLLEHPAFIAMQKINQNHPSFEETTNNVTTLEVTFYNKWGITFENNKDGKVSDKVLNFIKKGEMLNATKAYKDENNLTLNEAKNKVNRIAKDYKYKI